MGLTLAYFIHFTFYICAAHTAHACLGRHAPHLPRCLVTSITFAHHHSSAILLSFSSSDAGRRLLFPPPQPARLAPAPSPVSPCRCAHAPPLPHHPPPTHTSAPAPTCLPPALRPAFYHPPLRDGTSSLWARQRRAPVPVDIAATHFDGSPPVSRHANTTLLVGCSLWNRHGTNGWRLCGNRPSPQPPCRRQHVTFQTATTY